MILIGEQKYSCLECIRGHRSSSCRHYGRPLLQVRTKGRPNTHTTGHKNHRIAVFAEEIESDPDLPHANGSKCSKANPVIILKASAKHIIDFTSGKIIRPLGESNCSALPKTTGPYISEDSFINSVTCETGGIVKPKKGCNCCPNRGGKVNKSRIVSSYLKRRREQQPALQFIDYSDEIPKQSQERKPSLSSSAVVKTPTSSSEDLSLSGDQSQYFDVWKVPSCTIPGSCCCGDDCGCAGCMVHGNSGAGPLKVDNTNLNHEYINYINLLIMKDTQNMMFSSIASPELQIPGKPSGPSLPNDQGIPDQGISDEGIAGAAIADEGIPNPGGQCVCPPGACDCPNCETHGIIDGLHLDDLFAATLNPTPLREQVRVKTERGGCCSSAVHLE